MRTEISRLLGYPKHHKCIHCMKKRQVKHFETYRRYSVTYLKNSCKQCSDDIEKKHKKMVQFFRCQPKADHTQQFFLKLEKGWENKVDKVRKERRNFCTGRSQHQKKYGKDLGAAIHKVSYLIKKTE